jgi:fibronectin-binding autotransporter adhesin
MSVMQRKCAIWCGTAFAVLLAILLTVGAATAADTYTSWGGVTPTLPTTFTDDMSLVTNWGNGLPVVPGVAGTGSYVEFYNNGNHNPILNQTLNFKTATFLNELSGDVSITSTDGLGRWDSGNNNNSGLINSCSNYNVTIDVPIIMMWRSGRLITGDWTIDAAHRGNGNLTIGHADTSVVPQTSFYITRYTNSNPYIEPRNGGDDLGTEITIYAAVDFSQSSSTTSGNHTELRPESNSTIRLLGGLTGETSSSRNPGKDVRAYGQTGGRTILGSSPTWSGNMNIYTSDVEIKNSDSLGVAGSASGGYTNPMGTTNTGALRVTGNISTAEYIYPDARDTEAYPHIRNISGNNTLSGTIDTELSAATGGGAGYVTISSDGTASGDMLTLTGNFIRPFSGTTLVLSGAGNGLASGVIDAGYNVKKSGAGTWTLTGNNTYGGDTTVSEGTLKIQPPTTTLMSSTVSVADGAKLAVTAFSTASAVINAGTALNLGTTTGSTLDITLVGTPTVAPLTTGTFTTAGTTTLNISSTAAMSVGQFPLISYFGSIGGAGYGGLTLGTLPLRMIASLVDNAGVSVDLKVDGSDSIRWNGTSSNVWNINAAANWKSVTYSTDEKYLQPTIPGDVVSFTDAAAGFFNVNVAEAVNPASMTFTNSANDYTISGLGITTNSVNVTGSRNVTLANGNLTVTGSFTLNGTGKTTIANTGTLALPAPIAINSGTLAFNPTGTATVTGAMSGAGTLRKEGTNTLIVNGDNSAFLGPIDVAAGTLRTVGMNALGAASGSVTVSDGATLDIWDNNPDNKAGHGVKTVTITGSGVGGIGALISTQGSDATSASVSSLVVNGNSKIAAIGGVQRSIIWIDGPITGNGHDIDVVLDPGASSSEIDWLNAGDTNFNDINISGGGGALYISGNTTLGPITGKVVLKDKGRLGFYGLESTGLIDKPITVDNTTNGGVLEIYGGTKTVDSPITMNGNLEVDTWSLSNNYTAVLTLAGKLTGAGALTVHHVGNSTSSRRGMVELTSDANDFTGAITIGGGGGSGGGLASRDRITLSVGNGGTTGTLGTLADVTINGISGYETLLFNRQGSYTVPNNIVTTGSLNYPNIRSDNLTGDVTLTGIISGPSYVEVTNGSMTFAGNNTYEGQTIIANAGQLVVAHNSALGAVGAYNGGYTEMNGGTETSALVLKNNLTGVGEFIWLGGRSSFAAPQIINRSGDNTLSGTLQADLGGHSYALQSDGTAAGDIFRISGTIQTPSAIDILGGLGGVSTLSLQGAGNGQISGSIIEQYNNVWALSKDGAGTWSLTGTVAYTGNTTVNAGTLAITGNLSTPTATVSVVDSAILTAGSIRASTLSIGTPPPAAAIPEPSTWVLLVVGGLFAALLRRKAK